MRAILLNEFFELEVATAGGADNGRRVPRPFIGLLVHRALCRQHLKGVEARWRAPQPNLSRHVLRARHASVRPPLLDKPALLRLIPSTGVYIGFGFHNSRFV